jgi:hypothetical protein
MTLELQDYHSWKRFADHAQALLGIHLASKLLQRPASTLSICTQGLIWPPFSNWTLRFTLTATTCRSARRSALELLSTMTIRSRQNPVHSRWKLVQTSGKLVLVQTSGKLVPVQASGKLVPVQASGKLVPVQASGKLVPVQASGDLVPVRSRRKLATALLMEGIDIWFYQNPLLRWHI